MHIDVKYQNETQDIIVKENDPTMEDYEKLVKNELEYIGVHEHWKLYRLKNRV